MIYYVTFQDNLFKSENYEIVTPEKSLEILQSLGSVIGLDIETEGLDPYTKKLLSLQLGTYETQIVIDCTTVSVFKYYKDYLEREDIIFLGWNLCFDLKFLYLQGIFPNRVYDGMLAEKLLYNGYPSGMHGMSLKDAADTYLGINLDKTVRGKIITQGLTDEVVVYGASDVKYLEKIKDKQMILLERENLKNAIEFENLFVPVNAYFEYCGAKIDPIKWSAKIENDLKELERTEKILNDWVVKWENEALSKRQRIFYVDVSAGRGDNLIEADVKLLKSKGAKRRPDLDKGDWGNKGEAYELPEERRYTRIDYQGDLWSGFDFSPKCTIKWSSSKQVIPFFKELGINTEVVDRKTKKKKDSVQENVIKSQGGRFPIIPLYLDYKGAKQQVDSFGDKFLKLINPVTKRIHANFWQLGTDTGRVSSTDPNLQQLPKQQYVRACFIAEKGNKWISCDYSGQESYVMAYLADDKEMIKELLEGSGDLHSLTARMVFPEIPTDTPLEVVKKKYHDLRDKAKGYEFAFNYYGNDATLVRNYGIDKKWAKTIYDRYMTGFSGLCAYQQRQVDFVMKYGYIILNKLGHRAHIYDFDEWENLKEVDRFKYNLRVSETKKQSVNYRIQGTGAVMFKLAAIKIFRWIKRNNLLNIVKFCIPVHDEINIECPTEMADTIANVIVKAMESAGRYFCPTVPLTASCDIGDFWIHN